MTYTPGEVISHHEMCGEEEASLQRGMNYRLRPGHSVVLMSRRPNALYEDRVVEDGTVIIYEGHDQPRRRDGPDSKTIDQPRSYPSGKLTQNGLFYDSAPSKAELVRVYEKLRPGTWVFNGTFLLTEAWQERSHGRQVFKFRLELTENDDAADAGDGAARERSRVVPSSVKQEVWKRDHGRCVLCGEDNELHFDHDVPFSRGGSSTVQNVRLLCARHNLEKGARIE